MCGRFVLFTTGDELLAEIGGLPGVREVHAPDGLPGPRYNVAPTQVVPIVRFDSSDTSDTSLAQVDPARWGLLPHWKKDDSGPPLFNARGETVAEKPSFRAAFQSRRSIMVLDGYYEWHEKQPYYVRRPEGLLYAAGVWDSGGGDDAGLSTTMVTTDSHGGIEWLHHRLPLFLCEDDIAQWVHGSPEQAQELIRPSVLADELIWQEADPAVGNVRHDYEGLMADSTTLF
ncbi:SOS response-associated peptidase [Corynebacterium cystitidis]|uniref:SOS response-associated peptidase n=1 Tax=Corynebacterium cystitidis TaxID=35757 RepID=UPI00211E4499|nr:SOS response-associated peptidase [Corynebacterium cystitidis]